MAIRQDEEECVLGNSIFDCALLLIIGHSLMYIWSLHGALQLNELLETSEVLTLVGLYLFTGTVLGCAFYGTLISSALYFRPFCYLQYICYCGLIGYEMYQATFPEPVGTQFYLQMVFMIALAYGMFCCTSVSCASLMYFERIQLDLQGRGTRIGVFRQQLFGTPPLRRCDHLETTRASVISDSMLVDDIFDDYSISAKLE